MGNARKRQVLAVVILLFVIMKGNQIHIQTPSCTAAF